MIIFTARLSKKRIILLLAAAAAAVLILFLVWGLVNAGNREVPKLTDNAARMEYLQSWGWEVESEPVETLQFLVPEPLEEPYLTYNALQKEQGFDLTDCCGKQIDRYTYTVTNYPGRQTGVQLNLYVCLEQPVAGDVIATGADGFQAGLRFPEKAEAAAS